MREAIATGNAETMKKAGRECSGVFVFASKGQPDLRLDGIPWNRIACALLYHLKHLRVWLQRPAPVRSFLARVFGGLNLREVSPNDALYAVVLRDADGGAVK